LTCRRTLGNHRGLRTLGFAFRRISTFFLKIFIFRATKLLRWLAHRLSRSHHAEIVLGKLKIALGHYIIAGGLRIAAKLHVFLGNRLRGSAHLNVRPIALINTVNGVATAVTGVAASATTRAAITATTAALAAVLSLTCAMSAIEVQIITSAKKCRPILLRFCITISKIGP
jgi:hypothetical protein